MKKKILISFLIVIIFLLIWFISIRPSQDKDWREDLVKLTKIEIVNEKILIKGLRDWRYDENGPISKKWTNKKYNLNDMEGAWFVIDYFSEFKGAAHTMFVFDFKNDEPIVISIEARKEVDETYSAFKGIFKKFEISYLWGTEQDFIARRVITQKDDVYMLPLDIHIDYAKVLFLDLIDETNKLYKEPEFYNTLTKNCTNLLADSANESQQKTIPWHVSRVLPGYSDELLYKLGYIKSEGTLEEIKEKYYINKIIDNIPQENYSEFSKILREELSK